jgi:hypothetical protein
MPLRIRNKVRPVIADRILRSIAGNVVVLLPAGAPSRRPGDSEVVVSVGVSVGVVVDSVGVVGVGVAEETVITT